MTDHSTFEAACRSVGVGKRLDIENYPHVPAFPVYDKTTEVANELISSARDHLPDLPPIHFGFLDSKDVNAVAFRHGDPYFIGITSGAVIMLHLILDRILASPLALTWIGDPKKERNDIPPLPPGIIDPERLFRMGIRPVVAQDLDRIRYSKHLGDQAMMFLLGHEIAHITRGHVDFLNTSRPGAFIAEVGWSGSGIESLDRQCIEADADRRSVFARSVSMNMTAEHNDGTSPPWLSRRVEAVDYQFDWSFAVNVLFRLFGDERFTASDLKASGYPPLALRRRMAMEYACRVLLHYMGEGVKDSITKSVVGSISVCEDSFTLIGAEPAKGGFSDAFTDDATKHYGLLNSHWASMAPELQKHSYETLQDK